MDTQSTLLLTMTKCSIRYNSKNITEWADKLTYSQMAKDMASQFAIDGICLRREISLTAEELKSELNTTEGE